MTPNKLLCLLMLGTSLFATQPAQAAKEVKFDFSTEKIGAEPTSFVPTVGNWVVGKEGDNVLLMVEGSTWSRNQPSAGIADKARALYGERYAEFLDSVKSYAYYPLAVAKEVGDFREGVISFRFKGISGRIDQGAGIAFNLKPNGDYLILRANCLEDNLVLFKYERGNRSALQWIRNTPTPSKQWHELKLVVQGKNVKGYLDGKLYLEHALSEPVSGRIGLWSKADSVVYFDDIRIESTGRNE